MISTLATHIRELGASKSVLRQLVSQQLILRYRRTVLGYLWTLVNPLISITIMAVVFSTLFKQDLKTFTLFLFAGIIPWNFFNAVVVQSGASFIQNESLIKKIYLPKIIFPLSVTSAILIDSALSLIALFTLVLLIGGSLTWTALFIPFAYLLLFFFAFGIGLITAVATVFFRDLQHVILIAMQGLFFLTPVVYQRDALAGKVAWIVGLNPVIPFIDLFRAPLSLHVLPSWHTIGHAALLAFASMAVGVTVFVRQEKKIVFRL